MKGIKLAKAFGAVSLAGLLAGCGASGYGNSYGGPGLPPSASSPRPAADAQVDAATQVRIMEAQRNASANNRQNDLDCSLSDRFDNDTGIISYQPNRQTNIAIGIDGDGTDADLGGDINVQLTIQLQRSQTQEQKCRGDYRYQGIIPSAGRILGVD